MLACVGLPEAASSLERAAHPKPFTATAAMQPSLGNHPAPPANVSCLQITLDVYFLVNMCLFFFFKKTWCFLSLRNLDFLSSLVQKRS